MAYIKTWPFKWAGSFASLSSDQSPLGRQQSILCSQGHTGTLFIVLIIGTDLTSERDLQSHTERVRSRDGEAG